MVGAMVSFLDTETNASLIPITDSDGVALPNPLYTGSDGRLRLDNGNGAPAVPCIEDGLSYKVVVARRTGVEPVYIGGILQNASELYEEPYIAFVVTASGSAGGSNSTVVGSIAEVRLADPDLGSVVCSGYYSAGDCPSRVYSWVVSQNPPADNALNILRNPDHSTGYWKMAEPDGGMWDVRIAGMQTSNTPAVNDQCLTRLLNIINGSTTAVATVYFPKGEWLLDSGFVCGSLCLEKEANLKPADNSNNRTVTVAFLENRGGHFCATTENDTTAKRVLPVLTGLLRTSWLKGTLAEFLTSGVLNGLKTIDFDRTETNSSQGAASVEITEKTLLNIQNKPDVISWSNCFTLDNEQTADLYKAIVRSDLRIGAFNFRQSSNALKIVRDNGVTITDFVYFILAIGEQPNAVSFRLRAVFNGDAIFKAPATFDDEIFCNDDIRANVITAVTHFSGLLLGTAKGHIKPTSLTVEVKGGGSSGSTRNYTISTVDKEEFVIAVDMDVARYSEDVHGVVAIIKDSGSTQEIVISAYDREARQGQWLLVGYRDGNNYFFTYDHERWFPYGVGVFHRNKT